MFIEQQQSFIIYFRFGFHRGGPFLKWNIFGNVPVKKNSRIIPNKRKPVAEFKEFERRFKFKPRFKYGWFHLKLYQMFQDLGRRFI